MPLYDTRHISPEVVLAVWRVEETVNELLQQVYLSKLDKEMYRAIRNENRRKEWLATRFLLQLMLEEELSISYEDSGKPYILNSDWNISISHKKDFVGIILAKNKRVAIDIEELSGRIDKIYDYYLQPEELQQLVRNQRNYQMHLYWCAKECLIKLTGNRSLSIINDMYVHPIHPIQETFTAEVRVNDEVEPFEMYYEKLSNDYVVVWSVAEEHNPNMKMVISA